MIDSVGKKIPDRLVQTWSGIFIFITNHLC